MPSIFRRFGVMAGLALLLAAPARTMAQQLPARNQIFQVTGADSATGQPIELLLNSKPFGRGRHYTGTCRIGAGAKTNLTGEWQLVQNSDAGRATGPTPTIAGMGTRKGTKPWRQGQTASAAGQLLFFTIEPGPDGRYHVLLMDNFTDDALEFAYDLPKATSR